MVVYRQNDGVFRPSGCATNLPLLHIVEAQSFPVAIFPKPQTRKLSYVLGSEESTQLNLFAREIDGKGLS